MNEYLSKNNQFKSYLITYPVRLSDVIRNYVHFCSVVYLKALTSGPTTLTSNVKDLTSGPTTLSSNVKDLTSGPTTLSLIGLKCPGLGLDVQILSLTTLLEF